MLSFVRDAVSKRPLRRCHDVPARTLRRTGSRREWKTSLSPWLYALPKLNSRRTMPCLQKNIPNPSEQSTRNLAGCLDRKDSNTFHWPWLPLGYCRLSLLMREHSSLWSSVIFRGTRCLQTHKDGVCSGPHAEWRSTCHVTHLPFRQSHFVSRDFSNMGIGSLHHELPLTFTCAGPASSGNDKIRRTEQTLINLMLSHWQNTP